MIRPRAPAGPARRRATVTARLRPRADGARNRDSDNVFWFGNFRTFHCPIIVSRFSSCYLELKRFMPVVPPPGTVGDSEIDTEAAMRVSSEGNDKPRPAEEELPIDINYVKFTDWLLDRQKIKPNWRDLLRNIQQKV